MNAEVPPVFAGTAKTEKTDISEEQGARSL
jgi:hypothetical protein